MLQLPLKCHNGASALSITKLESGRSGKLNNHFNDVLAMAEALERQRIDSQVY
jgi:hypothetical protein